MGILYVMKSFGRYFYFKTEQARIDFIATLPEYEQKTLITYESRFGKEV